MNNDNLNNIGFIGNTYYNLKYLSRTRNFRYTWPYNNVFNRSKDENYLFRSILLQDVGIKRNFNVFGKEEFQCLRRILRQFLHRHKLTDYKLLLRKSQKKKNENTKLNNELQPITRSVVKTFIHKLIFNVIPFALFGSKQNRIQFEQNLRKIIFTGKFQVFSLSTVMLNISSKRCPYLKSVTGHINKTNILSKIYIWLVKVFICAALKCVFYVTESNYSNKYLFYDKRTWQSIQQKCFNSVKKKVIGNYNSYVIKKFTISSPNLYIMRMLPKRRGIRPVFMKWKIDDRSKTKILKYQMVKKLVSKIASSYFMALNTSPKNFHGNWLSLYFMWCTLGKPKAYFVRTDFVNAYGSIIHQKLIEIIRKIQKENRNGLESENDTRHCLRKISVKDAFKLLEDCITDFKFKDNKFVYALTEGISQGCPLSGFLCNLYFGDIDQIYLSEFINDKFGLFTRNCDDYLYITFNKEKASKFLKRLEDGFPDYNLRINYDKTETNICSDFTDTVSFSRFRVDVTSFQLHGCYKSYSDISIFHTSKFLNIASPGTIIRNRLIRFCSMKLDEIYFDSTYNTVDTIMYNVYLSASLTATRCYSYMNALFIKYNDNFIFYCITNCSYRVAETVSKKINDNKDIINKEILRWTVLKAFVVKLEGTKSINFTTILAKIRRISKTLAVTFSECQKQVVEKIDEIKQPAEFRSLS